MFYVNHLGTEKSLREEHVSVITTELKEETAQMALLNTGGMQRNKLLSLS